MSGLILKSIGQLKVLIQLLLLSILENQAANLYTATHTIYR